MEEIKIYKLDKLYSTHLELPLLVYLEQESVAVVPEVHAFTTQEVNSLDLPSQGLLDQALELFWVLVHQLVTFLVTQLYRVVT